MVELLGRRAVDLLLEQDGTEAGIEGTDTLGLQHLAEAADETVRVRGLGDKADTGSLERAKTDVGEELGSTGRGEVDTGPVVGGILNAEEVDGLLLEELVSTELQGALQEVTGEGRAKTGQESTGTLVGNDLAETTDHTTVVGDGVELDSRLDAVANMLSVARDSISGGEMHAKAVVRDFGYSLRSAERAWQRYFLFHGGKRVAKTYTSTGVRAPWVTAQQTAPAMANLE